MNGLMVKGSPRCFLPCRVLWVRFIHGKTLSVIPILLFWSLSCLCFHFLNICKVPQGRATEYNLSDEIVYKKKQKMALTVCLSPYFTWNNSFMSPAHVVISS